MLITNCTSTYGSGTWNGCELEVMVCIARLSYRTIKKTSVYVPVKWQTGKPRASSSESTDHSAHADQCRAAVELECLTKSCFP